MQLIFYFFFIFYCQNFSLSSIIVLDEHLLPWKQDVKKSEKKMIRFMLTNEIMLSITRCLRIVND